MYEDAAVAVEVAVAAVAAVEVAVVPVVASLHHSAVVSAGVFVVFLSGFLWNKTDSQLPERRVCRNCKVAKSRFS